MDIAALNEVTSIFRKRYGRGEFQEKLFCESLLIALARASSSDANVAPVEVRTIQGILKREIRQEVNSTSIRVAAKSRSHDRSPLVKTLARARRKLDPEARLRIVKYVTEVMESDHRLSVLEIDFLNRVAKALHLTPAALAGMKAKC